MQSVFVMEQLEYEKQRPRKSVKSAALGQSVLLTLKTLHSQMAKVHTPGAFSVIHSFASSFKLQLEEHPN